ncbi:hypothetical protein D3C84_775460 [compost metagenome]
MVDSAMHSMAIRFKSATCGSVQSLAIPSMRRSASPPRCSSTLRRLGPNPRSRNNAAIAAGLWPSLLSTSRRTPLNNCALSAAIGRATTDSVTTSCNGQPIRAAAREQEEEAGKINISLLGNCRARLAPTPKNIGSPLASTQTGSPRMASNASRENGLGQVRRSPRMQGGNRSNCRWLPKIVDAASNACRAALPKPVKPSSPIPVTVNQRAMCDLYSSA